ncbi:MAG TPA: carboxyl transferase domain-containing protein [Acidimicrobiales bacterium]|nr:carboxyl transferase domain-containing protein [Acidimicrobiales bacterium]
MTVTRATSTPAPAPSSSTIAASGAPQTEAGDVGKGIVGAVTSVVGRIGGREVVIARALGSMRRGAITHADGVRLAEAADQARRLNIPFVLFVASSGADVGDGIAALHGWGLAAAAMARCSGQVPVITAATGPVVSGPALLLGLSDLVVMSSEAVAFVSGPQMVAEFTGIEISLAELGGTAAHATSGLCAVESDDVDGAVAELLEYLPSNTDEVPPLAPVGDSVLRSTPELRTVIPDRKAATYDVRDVVRSLCDDGEFRELWPRWAGQIVTAFGRMGGMPVGFVANQPRILAGTLDIAASQKGARFVRLCDAFNLPIVSLVDTPGFLPGKDLEWRGMIRHGAELAFSYAQATVPRLCLILRKAFGGAYIVMDSRGIGNDVCLAWPGAEVAVMGASGAVQILHRNLEPEERLVRQAGYEEAYLTPWPAAERGFVDQVVDPANSRIVLCAVLRQLATKRELVMGRKHDAGPQ